MITLVCHYAKGTGYNRETQLSEGSMKRPEIDIHDGQTYVKAQRFAVDEKDAVEICSGVYVSM